MRYPLAISMFVFLLGCGREVDTYNTQASADIAASKKNGFFVSAYSAPSVPYRSFFISSAWLEKAWRYKRQGDTIGRVLAGGYRLNLRLGLVFDTAYAEAGNPYHWEFFDDSRHDLFEKRGNVFSLEVKDSVLPEEFCVSIRKVVGGTTAEEIGEFEVFRTKPYSVECDSTLALALRIAAAKVYYEWSVDVHRKDQRENMEAYFKLVREFKAVDRTACLEQLLADSAARGMEVFMLNYVSPLSSYIGRCSMMRYADFVDTMLVNLGDKGNDSTIGCRDRSW